MALTISPHLSTYIRKLRYSLSHTDAGGTIQKILQQLRHVEELRLEPASNLSSFFDWEYIDSRLASDITDLLQGSGLRTFQCISIRPLPLSLFASAGRNLCQISILGHSTVVATDLDGLSHTDEDLPRISELTIRSSFATNSLAALVKSSHVIFDFSTLRTLNLSLEDNEGVKIAGELESLFQSLKNLTLEGT